MGISVNEPKTTATQEATVFSGVILEKENSTQALVPMTEQEVQNFTTNYKQQLRQLPEVEALTSEIQVDDFNSILQFGQAASEGISQVSNSLLANMKSVQSEEAGEIMRELVGVMNRFDSKELQEVKEPKGLQKIFNKAKKQIEEIFAKYDTMDKEVNNIYNILKKYETQIQVANQDLKRLYDENINYYQTLEKYIVAGEMGIEELDTKLIPQYEKEAQESGDRMAMTTVDNLHKVREMLEQRVYDLQIAENVALQTIPMIQGIQYSNFNLTRKINSAFIITLPIFKQSLAQAVMLRRQQLQAKNLQALDDKTNELLLRNAQNMVSQTTQIAKMAGTSSIDISTLERTWQTIMNGVDETRRIEEENHKQRVANGAKLEEMKAKMLTRK